MNCYGCKHSVLSDDTSKGRWKCGSVHPGKWVYMPDKETKKCSKYEAIRFEPPIWLTDDGRDDE